MCSSIRFLHNIYNTVNLSISYSASQCERDIILLAGNLAYKEYTRYIPISHGEIELIITTTDGTNVIKSRGELRSNNRYTCVISGIPSSPQNQVLTFLDTKRCPCEGKYKLRAIQATPDTGPISFTIDGTVAFTNLQYSSASSYVELSPSVQTMISSFISISPMTVVTPVMTTMSTPVMTSAVVSMMSTDQTSVISNMASANLVETTEAGKFYTVVSSGNVSNPAMVWMVDNTSCDKVVDDFDIDKYMGIWYQIASISMGTCNHSSSTYTPLQDNIKVDNGCYDINWRLVSTTEGSAFSDPVQQAKWALDFSPTRSACSSPINYLVHSTDYVTYSLVGSPQRDTLVILSRCREMKWSVYTKLVKLAKSLGYQTNQLIIDNSCIKSDNMTCTTCDQPYSKYQPYSCECTK